MLLPTRKKRRSASKHVPAAPFVLIRDRCDCWHAAARDPQYRDLFFLGGGFTTIAFLPQWLHNISVFNPIRYSIDGMRQALFYPTLSGFMPRSLSPILYLPDMVGDVPRDTSDGI